MIRLAIVEDNTCLRRELVDQLGRLPGIEIVGEFPNHETAAADLPLLKPDVVLTDIQLPGRSGIDLVQALKPRLPKTEFLILTTFDDDDLVFEALRAGAVGYLLKRDRLPEIAVAIQDIQRGGSPMSSSIARKVVHAFQGPAHGGMESLAPREQELLQLLARGRIYKECADALGLSIHTVRTYIRRIYKKLEVNNRHEAVAKVKPFRGPEGK